MTDVRAGALHGQHAVVTGGSRGIGAAIAGALAAAGADVTILGRTAADLEAHAGVLRERTGRGIRAIPCDVGRHDDLERALVDAARNPGPITILINNAGHPDATAFQEITLASWNQSLALNVTSALIAIQRVLPSMIAAGSGRIVNIASTAGLKGYAKAAAYSASKHALVGLTRALAAEMARTGVTINAVCPGYTENTGMLDAAVGNIMRTTGRSADEARAVLVRQSPRGTLVTADEIAATVTWLCSAGASAITGQAIAVAGGEVM